MSPPRLARSLVVLAHLRTVHARHRVLRRAARIMGVGVLAWGMWSAVASLEHARARWGDTATVIVASAALEPGDRLDAVRLVDWPVALVPRDALTSLDRRRVVRHHVGEGEVLTRSDIGDDAGLVGLVPHGHGVVHVPASADQRAVLHVGDPVVAVVAGRSVTGGQVVAIGADSIAVALPRAAVATVTGAVIDGTAAVALAP